MTDAQYQRLVAARHEGRNPDDDRAEDGEGSRTTTRLVTIQDAVLGLLVAMNQLQVTVLALQQQIAALHHEATRRYEPIASEDPAVTSSSRSDKE